MLPEIHEWLFSEGGSVGQKVASRSHFRTIVRGDEIDDLNDIKRFENPAFVSELFEDEVWAIKPSFKPGIRFLGAFATPDWFIVLLRRERNSLKTVQSQRSVVAKVKVEWEKLLPAVPRFKGNSLQDYLTYNAEHRDERW